MGLVPNFQVNPRVCMLNFWAKFRGFVRGRGTHNFVGRLGDRWDVPSPP